MSHNSSKIKLVEGIFSPINSADVLLSLIADKIKFHNLQLLSISNDNDPDGIKARKRIDELKESRKIVTDLIIKGRNEGLCMKIDGIINIEMFKQTIN